MCEPSKLMQNIVDALAEYVRMQILNPEPISKKLLHTVLQNLWLKNTQQNQSITRMFTDNLFNKVPLIKQLAHDIAKCAEKSKETLDIKESFNIRVDFFLENIGKTKRGLSTYRSLFVRGDSSLSNNIDEIEIGLSSTNASPLLTLIHAFLIQNGFLDAADLSKAYYVLTSSPTRALNVSMIDLEITVSYMIPLSKLKFQRASYNLLALLVGVVGAYLSSKIYSPK